MNLFSIGEATMENYGEAAFQSHDKEAHDTTRARWKAGIKEAKRRHQYSTLTHILSNPQTSFSDID